MNKELCVCGKIATYWYAPAYENKKNEQNYFCGDCVPRGCSCNQHYIDLEETPKGEENIDWRWVEEEEGKIWVGLNSKGQESPCCEFFYEKDGYDI